LAGDLVDDAAVPRGAARLAERQVGERRREGTVARLGGRVDETQQVVGLGGEMVVRRHEPDGSEAEPFADHHEKRHHVAQQPETGRSLSR
jgi:hypothetical protein